MQKCFVDFVTMFLQLSLTKLDIFEVAEKLVLESYRLAPLFPTDERFNLVSQIKRASMSIILNLAEGASRTTNNERKRFYEISRGSVIEVDTAIHMAIKLGFVSASQAEKLGELLYRSYGMLSKMIERLSQKI